jgi:hypothetical protein
MDINEKKGGLNEVWWYVEIFMQMLHLSSFTEQGFYASLEIGILKHQLPWNFYAMEMKYLSHIHIIKYNVSFGKIFLTDHWIICCTRCEYKPGRDTFYPVFATCLISSASLHLNSCGLMLKYKCSNQDLKKILSHYSAKYLKSLQSLFHLLSLSQYTTYRERLFFPAYTSKFNLLACQHAIRREYEEDWSVRKSQSRQKVRWWD